MRDDGVQQPRTKLDGEEVQELREVNDLDEVPASGTKHWPIQAHLSEFMSMIQTADAFIGGSVRMGLHFAIHSILVLLRDQDGLDRWKALGTAAAALAFVVFAPLAFVTTGRFSVSRLLRIGIDVPSIVVGPTVGLVLMNTASIQQWASAGPRE